MSREGAGYDPPTVWCCRACRAPLGVVRGDGALEPQVPAARINSNGAAHVRCPACAVERLWKPKPLRDVETMRDSQAATAAEGPAPSHAPRPA